jgi:hypothetical protein
MLGIQAMPWPSPAPFTDAADFVVFERTHLKGRQQIASFTQQIFDTVWQRKILTTRRSWRMLQPMRI